MSTPIIVFVEVPRFYAAIERARSPELRDRPILVGGDPRKRGRVQSASAEAEDAGVEVGMEMLTALEMCPRARPLRTDMRSYREISEMLHACWRSEIDALEPDGLAAGFLDAGLAHADPEAAARRMCQRIREELELPLRIGIAPVRFVAQLAAREVGESGILRVEPGHEETFLAPLPVHRLPGIGPKARAELESMGVATVGQLVRLDRHRLEERLGNRGLRILEYARGHDTRGVRAARHPRSTSQELTFASPEAEASVLGEALQKLARGVEESLRRQGLAGRRVGVKVRFATGPAAMRSQTAARPVSTAADLADLAVTLLARTDAGARPVRGIGITVTQLAHEVEEDRQLDLFSGER